MVTLWFGHISGASLFWIWVGFLVSLASTFHWLVIMDQWLYARRVKDKIAFSRVNVGRIIDGSGIFMQVLLENTADFPIEFQVDDIRTRVGNVVPTRTDHLRNPITIPPKGYGWYSDHAIEIEKDHPRAIEGYIEYKIRYGRNGNLKYTLSGKKQVVAVFDENGVLQEGSWNEAQ